MTTKNERIPIGLIFISGSIGAVLGLICYVRGWLG